VVGTVDENCRRTCPKHVRDGVRTSTVILGDLRTNEDMCAGDRTTRDCCLRVHMRQSVGGANRPFYSQLCSVWRCCRLVYVTTRLLGFARHTYANEITRGNIGDLAEVLSKNPVHIHAAQYFSYNFLTSASGRRKQTPRQGQPPTCPNDGKSLRKWKDEGRLQREV